MAITVYTSLFKAIQLDSAPLATAGGEGAVHKIINCTQYQNHCVKIFHLLKRTDAKKNKVAFMILNKPSNLASLPYSFCWPIELIYDNNQKFIGFVMPLAFDNSEKLYELAALKMSPKLSSSWQKFSRETELGFQNRLKICIQIAGATHAIHKSGTYTVIDFKPQNILLNSDGKISITDIDSFQISTGIGITLHHAEVITPEYAPSEYHKAPHSNVSKHENWDRFSLAVSFYEILFGLHPYAASCNDAYVIADSIGEKIKNGLFVHGSKKSFLSSIPPPHNKFHSLPFTIKSLFIKAFENGHTNPAERPSAEIWGGTLYNEVLNKAHA